MRIKEWVVFGDSLSDDGNLYALGEGVVPDLIRKALTGPTGAVSDGPTHAFYTAQFLPSVTTLSNWAYAAGAAIGTKTGAELADEQGLTPFLLVPPDDPRLAVDVNLGGQVDAFLADAAGRDLGNSTAFILIGALDYRGLSLTDTAAAQQTVGEVIASIGSAADALIGAGIDRVFFGSLPDVTVFPAYANLAPVEALAAQQVVQAHNAALAQLSATIYADGSAGSKVINMTSILQAMAEDPTGFGFVAPYLQTQTESSVLSRFDPDQVAWYDDLHPSTAAHAILAASTAFRVEGGGITTATDQDDKIGRLNGKDYLMFGLGGDDTLWTGVGDDVIFGGSGNDYIRDNGGRNILSGGAGNDILVDTVSTRFMSPANVDFMNGGPGDDRLLGEGGTDILVGGTGNDFVHGGPENDVLIHVQSTLEGGAGGEIDRYVGGRGTDTLYVALDSDSFDAFTNPAPGAGVTLRDLGIIHREIERVQVVEGRDGLFAAIGDAPWFPEADIWGLL